MAQEGPKQAQDGPQMAPRWPQLPPQITQIDSNMDAKYRQHVQGSVISLLNNPNEIQIESE